MAKKKPTEPLHDYFTALCRSDLHVDCIKEYKFHPTRRWRFDYAIPAHKIALEVEGGVWSQGRHTRPKGFLGDVEKYNTATLMGWRVLRTVPDALISGATLKMLKEAIEGP
jgi:very-short-patch-repair endonuclease